MLPVWEHVSNPVLAMRALGLTPPAPRLAPSYTAEWDAIAEPLAKLTAALCIPRTPMSMLGPGANGIVGGVGGILRGPQFRQH